MKPTPPRALSGRHSLNILFGLFLASGATVRLGIATFASEWR